jgi:hypothetical protein
MLRLLFFRWSDCAPTLPLSARSGVLGRWYRPAIARAATCDLYSVLCPRGVDDGVLGLDLSRSFQRRKGSGHYCRLWREQVQQTNLWPFGGCLTYCLVVTWPRHIVRTISCHPSMHESLAPSLAFQIYRNRTMAPLEVPKNSVTIERGISYAPDISQNLLKPLITVRN